MPTVADEYYLEEFWKLSGRGPLNECWEWGGKIRSDGYGTYTPPPNKPGEKDSEGS